MKKSILLFAIAFVLGTMLALPARAIWFAPPLPVDAPAPAAPAAPMIAHDHPAATPKPAGASAAQDVPNAKSVNSICTICGMDVDPAIPPALYQGKLVGFGCKACPPKFAADPDRYGPHALRNEPTP